MVCINQGLKIFLNYDILKLFLFLILENENPDILVIE